MPDALFLGIDTSNYTTSVALVHESGSILCNERMLLPVAEGARGLRQSDAVFAHVKQLPLLLTKAAQAAEGAPIRAVGFSARPRDVEGSYMPCFLVGQTAAQSAAMAAGVPCFDFSHQAGHVEAAAVGSGLPPEQKNHFLAFHISGGTTELLEVADGQITCIGGSRDLHAGQLIDRIGVRLGLPFPAGGALEALAENAEKEAVPRLKICTDGLFCSLSGLENQVIRLLEQGVSPSVAAAATLRAIGDTLTALTASARNRFRSLSIVYAGGVMRNQALRIRLQSSGESYFAPPNLSSDNAVGIALLCRENAMRSGLFGPRE